MRLVTISVAVAASLATAGSTMSSAAANALHGEYRSYYPEGSLYQLRHYVHGREEGLQQAWTETGDLYINYDVRNGRRYGFVNAKPCRPVSAEDAALGAR